MPERGLPAYPFACCKLPAERNTLRIMKRTVWGLSLLPVVLFFLTSEAIAVAPGHVVEWQIKGEGKVVFDGSVHGKKGLTCIDCHRKIFSKMSKGAPSAKMTMKEMEAGKYCGACHDGIKAFSVTDKINCKRCHIRG